MLQISLLANKSKFINSYAGQEGAVIRFLCLDGNGSSNRTLSLEEFTFLLTSHHSGTLFKKKLFKNLKIICETLILL
jgi:hypothetical protein